MTHNQKLHDIVDAIYKLAFGYCGEEINYCEFTLFVYRRNWQNDKQEYIPVTQEEIDQYALERLGDVVHIAIRNYLDTPLVYGAYHKKVLLEALLMLPPIRVADVCAVVGSDSQTCKDIGDICDQWKANKITLDKKRKLIEEIVRRFIDTELSHNK